MISVSDYTKNVHDIQTSANDNETLSDTSFQTADSNGNATKEETSTRSEFDLENTKYFDENDNYDDENSVPITMIEEEDKEDFLFLNDPKSEIFNVEEEKESKSIVDDLKCKYCHSIPCRNGKYLNFFKPAFLGIIVKYIGKDDKLFGKTGFVDYYVNGDLLVKWLDDCSRNKIPICLFNDSLKTLLPPHSCRIFPFSY